LKEFANNLINLSKSMENKDTIAMKKDEVGVHPD